MPDGAFINRHFKANEFEWYVQDSWRALPNLTVTFGLRHTILQTPWETHGQQVAPTIDTHAWFMQREAAAQVGQVYEPDLTFAPNGPFYHKPGYWPKQKANFAPRLACRLFARFQNLHPRRLRDLFRPLWRTVGEHLRSARFLRHQLFRQQSGRCLRV